MGDDDATVVFGAMSVFVTVVILFEFWYVQIKVQRKRIRRAQGFFKYVLKGRGRQSWDDIMREITADHAGEIDDNVALEVMASIMDKHTIQDIEKMNPYSGLYDPKAPAAVNNRHATEADAAVGIFDDLQDTSSKHDDEQAEYRALLRVTENERQRKRTKHGLAP